MLLYGLLELLHRVNCSFVAISFRGGFYSGLVFGKIPRGVVLGRVRLIAATRGNFREVLLLCSVIACGAFVLFLLLLFLFLILFLFRFDRSFLFLLFFLWAKGFEMQMLNWKYTNTLGTSTRV